MLIDIQFIQIDDVANGGLRQQPVAVIVLAVILAFLIHRHESGLDQH